MIELITGAPGSGKSLFAIWTIENRRKKENRDVYYNGITGINLPWIEFDDPNKWYELPAGAIIIIDEAQRVFRPRHSSAAVPESVSKLETHRHNGHDIYMITQHPTLIETNVRRLAESHHHLMRKFGAAWATIHTWKGVKENCDKTRKDSITKEFKYPKEVYKWYTSAEIHTHKFKLPWKLWLILLLPLIALIGLFFANSSIKKVGNEKPSFAIPAPVASQVQHPQVLEKMRKQLQENFTPESMAPRFPDLPFTAPRYDNITTATTAPVPAACVSSKSRCQCYTQQATPINVSESICRDFVAHGYFQDFLPSQQSQNQIASNKQEPTVIKNRDVVIPTPSQISPFPINAAKIKS